MSQEACLLKGGALRRRLSKELLGKQIREIRTGMGLSQADFAKALGLEASQAQVSKWERGKEGASYETLLKIAKAAGLPDLGVFEDPGDAPGGGGGPVRERGPGYADAPTLASLFSDATDLDELLQALEPGALLQAAYAAAKERGWNEGRLAQLDAAAAALMRRASSASRQQPVASGVHLDARQIAQISDAVARTIGMVPPEHPAADQRRRPRSAGGRRGIA